MMRALGLTWEHGSSCLPDRLGYCCAYLFRAPPLPKVPRRRHPDIRNRFRSPGPVPAHHHEVPQQVRPVDQPRRDEVDDRHCRMLVLTLNATLSHEARSDGVATRGHRPRRCPARARSDRRALLCRRVARKHPAYLYTFPPHARRAVLDTMLAEQANAHLAFHPAYRALTAGRAFWTELGRALQHHDAPTVAATCEVVADMLRAGRITARVAATLVRDWRLGRLGVS